MKQVVQTLILAAAGCALVAFILAVAEGRPVAAVCSVASVTYSAFLWHQSFDLEAD